MGGFAEDRASGATRVLATWAAGLTPGDVPSAVRDHARRAVLDHLGAAVPGSLAPVVGVVREQVTDGSRDGAATVVGSGLTARAADAALVNGTAGHALEVDDGYTPGSFHPGTVVVPAALAVAEAGDQHLDDLVHAVVVGYELSCRIAAAGHPATWRRGFHNTPIAGVFGAAAAAAVSLGLDGHALANALGVAGSHAGGLFEFVEDGSEVKRLHAGKAARDGVVSAALAAGGLTGPTSVLEGPQGYGVAFADGEFDVDAMLAGLGVRWAMLGTYTKPHACCRHLHGAIDAVLALATSGDLDPSVVEEVQVGTYAVALRHAPLRTATFLDAQMSLPFAVATALVHGQAGVAEFGAPARTDPGVLALAERVRVDVDRSCDEAYPTRRPTEVTVHTAEGPRVHRVEQPLGEPDNPMDDAAMVAKLHRLCDPVLGPARTDELVARVHGAGSVRALMAVVGGAAA